MYSPGLEKWGFLGNSHWGHYFCFCYVSSLFALNESYEIVFQFEVANNPDTWVYPANLNAFMSLLLFLFKGSSFFDFEYFNNVGLCM